MTTWAKEIDNQLKFASENEFPGVPNPFTHEQKCRDKGYLPLIDTPHEERDGYTCKPETWHKVTQSQWRTVPVEVEIPDFDPESGEQTGTHKEWRDEQREFDTSYILVDTYAYTPIPQPEPPPLKRQFSKGDLLEALVACGLYDAAKAVYAADLDLQIAWAGFANIDMDYTACQAIMQQYSELFTPANVEAIQRYITFGEVPNAEQ